MAAAGSQGEIRKLRKKLRQIENLERLERDLTQEEREKVKKNSTISLSPVVHILMAAILLVFLLIYRTENYINNHVHIKFTGCKSLFEIQYFEFTALYLK